MRHLYYPQGEEMHPSVPHRFFYSSNAKQFYLSNRKAMPLYGLNTSYAYIGLVREPLDYHPLVFVRLPPKLSNKTSQIYDQISIGL